ATPAGMVAHNISRNNYAKIAEEMILYSRLDVILGAGNPYYDNSAQKQDSSAWDFSYVGGSRVWSSLLAGKVTNLDGAHWTLTQNATTIDSIAKGLRKTPAALIGVMPVYETLQQRRTSVLANATLEPTPYTTPLNANVSNLPSLSLAALQVLNQNTKGFFVMIEGGAIDWTGHSNQSARLIEEGMDFLDAVDSVCAWINRHGGPDSTLLIVTADHETGYLSGPSGLGSEIVLNAKGVMPGFKWNTYNHTNQLVRLYAQGTHSANLLNWINGTSPVQGSYTDNALVGQYLHSMLDIPLTEARRR
ncbi:MAG TPA: alkaline phosphatase, partial [Fibrobacteraceae bacterium]|nr:alkaline phosphatase [Fibrobacteraceae bacterium]